MKLYIFLYYIILGINISSYIAESLKLEKIVGGIKAGAYQFKYQVSLHRNNRLRCGGAILAEYFIISAAHCFINVTSGKFINNNFTVVASAHNLYDTTQSAVIDYVAKVFVPKAFQPYKHNPKVSHHFQDDIAVVKLKNGLKLDQHPQLSSLNIGSLVSSIGQTLVMTGHGFYRVTVKLPLMDYGETRIYGYIDGRLRYARVVTLNPNICYRYYPDFNPEKQICGKVEQRSSSHPDGACMGDSGSPIVFGGEVLVGIVSYIEEKCRENIRPAVYTKVEYYSQFIDNAMNNRKTNQMRVAKWKKPFFIFKYQFLED